MVKTYPQDLGGVDTAKLSACIEACFECAQACTACARTSTAPTCAKRPGASCPATPPYADAHDHCRACAEACRRCEQACRELINAL